MEGKGLEGVIKPKGAKKLLEERVRHRRFQGDQGGLAEQRQEMTELPEEQG